MTTSVDLTILGELEKLSPQSGATDLISLLLKNYAIEMKESRRNLLASGQLLSRSKQAFHSIETLIDNVNKTALTDFSSAWTDFENYTEAIPILERILFDFHLKVPTGLNSYARTHLPPADVTEGLIFITTWELDRKCIADTFNALSDRLSLAQIRLPGIAANLKAEWTQERNSDDSAMLKALGERLQFLRPSDRWVTQTRGLRPVTDALSSFSKVYQVIMKSPPQSDLWIVFTMKTLLLSLIPFEILGPSSTHKDKANFRSVEIFRKIEELLNDVASANRSADPTTELQEKWVSLKALLLSLGGSISLVQDLAALIQQAGRIRRPFQGRSVRLIQMVRVLEMHVAKYPNSHDQGLVQVLMKNLLTLLVDAEKAVVDVKDYKIDSENYKGTVSQFHSALTVLEKHFKDFELGSEWEAQKKKYDDVVKEVDEKHLRDFLKEHHRSSSRSTTIPATQTLRIIKMHRQTTALHYKLPSTVEAIQQNWVDCMKSGTIISGLLAVISAVLLVLFKVISLMGNTSIPISDSITLETLSYTSLFLNISSGSSSVLLLNRLGEITYRSAKDPQPRMGGRSYLNAHELLREFKIGKTWTFVLWHWIICLLSGIGCLLAELLVYIWVVESKSVRIGMACLGAFCVVPIFVFLSSTLFERRSKDEQSSDADIESQRASTPLSPVPEHNVTRQIPHKISSGSVSYRTPRTSFFVDTNVGPSVIVDHTGAFRVETPTISPRMPNSPLTRTGTVPC
ncbi:hypothetical protein CVT24_006771 [Panaeolus cyanescens]|uniref:Uncharacterized protein n=1 Tax=Panaeolus cyanescens TaxID=181874 RepID=A0A409V9F2_9AGAR|nr:hypothetical protein CVT24_006771 [Panaeolus cyanescens]